MWDGIEMVEIFYGLNMDDDSFVVVMFFFFVKGNIIDFV